MPSVTPNDRRAARTRRSLVEAFVELVLDRRYDEISVQDVVVRADVGRSTFYEHFRGKDDLLEQSMHWLLVMIAEAAEPQPDLDRLTAAVDHFWQNRRLARVIFSPPIAARVRRSLTRLIVDRLDQENGELRNARALQIAAAQLALLEAWTHGDLTAPPELIVAQLQAAARL
ncbi:MAG: regulatory protein TetR [Alphaproteobacteria bacterium]|nr:regulatory protein TetR [Alphaproteobacteria bacterium]